MRRIASCLSYEINKSKIYHFKSEDEASIYHKILMTELAIDMRKWQVFSKTVTKIDELTEEEKAKQIEQKEAIAKGEQIPEESLIKDPEPYNVDETCWSEFETEGKAYENFLLIFKPEYTERRVNKWKAKLQKLIPRLTNGEEVVEKLTDELDSNVAFWNNLYENPEAQINNEALKENPKFLEFTCKALQRVIEIGSKNEDELDLLIEAIKLKTDTISPLEESIEKTKNNLSQDKVARRQARFQLIESKVKEIQDSTKEINITMIDVPKLLNDIKDELANNEQFVKLEFSSEQTKYYLQVSQFLFVKSMITSMVNRKAFDYEKDHGSPSYQNIYLLDFTDLITQVNDLNEKLMFKKQQMREEIIEKQKRELELNPPAENSQVEPKKIPEIDEIEVPVKARINAISRNINLLSRAAQYSQASNSWVLLENIVKYTWNLITYELVSPLELSRTDAYKDISILTECILNILSRAKLTDTTVDERPETATSEKGKDTRTVKFADETQKSIKTEKTIKAEDSDIKFYSNFITYTIQCLFVAEKWESMVDLADTASKQFREIYHESDDDILFLLSYLLQFRIYAENKLYEAAHDKTEKVKEELDARIQQFNHWKATSKKSKSRQALLTGEIPKEELEFRRDKEVLEKEVFRLEVHEAFLKSDKEASEMSLAEIKKATNHTRENLRQCRKLYKKFGLETKALDDEADQQGYGKNMAMKIKSHAVLTNMVISSYSKAIEQIRKKKEKYLLIQAYNEIGNLYYSDGQLKNAETCWND